MALKHQNTYKHLLNFTGSPVRPVLTCFHYKSGDVVATNSHIVLKVKNLSPDNLGEFNFNPKTLEINTDAYPDIDRVIPTIFNSEWKITPACCSVITKLLKGFPRDARIKVKINLDGMEISNGEISSLFPIRLVAGDNRIEFTCNATYLKHILAFVVDYTDDLVTFGFVSEIRPMVFKVDGEFTAVLTPIRVPKGRA
ncbi:hypothetical protein [Enterococcus italicus]|uniref:hypothetical protein n=1 Tax=Enterococcus italicus TaxID=246144 RepID=UPI0020740D47|nr:hypothetical protein [Enterococcus italicus]